MDSVRRGGHRDFLYLQITMTQSLILASPRASLFPHHAHRTGRPPLAKTDMYDKLRDDYFLLAQLVMHPNYSFHSHRPHQDGYRAFTAEELVAAADVDAMQRFLACAGLGQKQDDARRALYAAAANGLCSVGNSRVYRICVYGWPVTFLYGSAVTVSSTIPLTSPQYPTKSSTTLGLMREIRDIWTRAFGSCRRVLVSPMIRMTHLYSVLGLTPMDLRRATQHGISLIQGVKDRSPWSFDQQMRSMTGSAELPLTYLFSAWVCWNVTDPVPDVCVDHDLRLKLTQLMRAVGTCPGGDAVDAVIGSPAVFYEAITHGQAMQLSAMNQCANGMEMNLRVETARDASNLKMNLAYVDLQTGDANDVQQWCYPHIWRPMDHLALMLPYEQPQVTRVH